VHESKEQSIRLVNPPKAACSGPSATELQYHLSLVLFTRPHSNQSLPLSVSPRASLPNMSIPSAEVAADFRDALQDLKQNSRPEISNLTIIAKENTEHAQAISHELESHIKAVSRH